MKARLIAARELAPDICHFEFESADWPLDFAPGQFVSLTKDGITRAYSVASPPSLTPDSKTGSGRFALCANLVQDGKFSPFLFGMQTGDEVDFKGPLGTFVLRRPAADSLFVATGTGIAPFRSMLHAQPDRKITLIFGVRHAHSLLYHDELQALADRNPDFIYQPTLTRPPEDWTGKTGRVQQHTFDALGDRHDMDIYICGMKEMVDDLRTQLKARGYDRKRIIYEKYD